MNELEFQALNAKLTAGTITPDELTQLQAETAVRAAANSSPVQSNPNGGASIANPAPTPTGTVLPSKSTFIGTLADVSELIEKNGKRFHILTFVDAKNENKTFAMNELFFERNASRLVLDEAFNITVETARKGKTHYFDAKDGNVQKVHDYDGDNITNVIRATKQQASELDVISEEAFFDRAQARLMSIDADRALAMATVMQRK